MLILSRKLDQSFLVFKHKDEVIKIKVVGIRKESCRIGIECSNEYTILREELLDPDDAGP